MLGEFWKFLHWMFRLNPTPTCLKDPQSSQNQNQLQHPTAFTSVLPTHCCGHTNKVANGVTGLCSLWSKNIHSTWYQQFKGFFACKGVVPGFPHVSKTRYVSYDNIEDFLNKYSESEICNLSCEVLVCLGDHYVLQFMHIMSQSLEGFSLPLMKETQDLDS